MQSAVQETFASQLFSRNLPVLIAFLAPLSVLALVRSYVIDVPFLDEWQWSPMIIAVHRGGLNWNDVWSLHNEQRIAVPTLVAFLLTAIDHHWVITRETTFSVSVVFATLAVWWKTITHLSPGNRKHWSLAMVSLLLSSLTQAENWTWGFQMSFFIANLSVAVIILCFVSSRRNITFIISVAALLIGTASDGFALTATVGGMAYFAMIRDRWKFVIWTGVSMIVISSYVHDFHASLFQGVNAPLLSRLSMMGAYACIALGAPVAQGAGIIWSGALGLAAALTVIVSAGIWLRKSTTIGRAGLIALGLICLCGAAELAYGRVFEGLDTALSGRFTTPMALTWVCLLLIASTARTSRLRIILIGCAPIFMFWIGSQIAGYQEFRNRSVALFAAAQVIPRWHVATEDEFPPLWPAEAFLSSLNVNNEGPFAAP